MLRKEHGLEVILQKKALAIMTVWPSGLRRWLKAPFRKGVGSNPTAVTFLQLRKNARIKSLRGSHLMLGFVRFSCFENLRSQVEF